MFASVKQPIIASGPRLSRRGDQLMLIGRASVATKELVQRRSSIGSCPIARRFGLFPPPNCARSAQERAVKIYVTKEKRTSVAAPSGFTVSTGAVLPESVEVTPTS